MELIHTVDAKVHACAARYCHIRAAMEVLSKHRLDSTSWTTLFRPLLDDDLVGLTFMDNLGSEGRRKLTWIWNIQVDGMEVDVDEASFTGSTFCCTF